jgi:Cof subfamily protein (haloacid dehalogenase superfamily)
MAYVEWGYPESVPSEGRRMIKLVLSDMDGTLVPFGHSSVSRRTLSAIAELRDAGIEFGPASGREPFDLMGYFDKDQTMGDTGIFANGKLVRLDGKDIFRLPLERAGVQALVDFSARRDDLATLVCSREQARRGLPAFQVFGATRERLAKYADDPETLSIPMTVGEELPAEDILTVDLICLSRDPARFAKVRDEVEAELPQFDFVSPGPGCLDVLPHGWNKGTAVEVLSDAMGVDVEQIAFFGDSENDLALMARVPNSFCVGNGTEDAQRAARYHIGDSADDSVAIVMESLAKNHGRIVVPPETSRD